MQEQRGAKRDVVSRVLEGDWRHGLTLYQLAMVDFAYLDDDMPSDQKQSWRYSTLDLIPIDSYVLICTPSFAHVEAGFSRGLPVKRIEYGVDFDFAQDLKGVELGKADYVAHMFAYLRPKISQ